MKKIVYILIVVVALGAVAWGTRTYNSRACNYEYAVLSRESDDCPDTTGEGCTSFYMSYPVFAKKLFPSAAVDSINARVYRTMVGLEDKTAEAMADEFFDNYRDFVAARSEIARQEGDSTMLAFTPTWYYNAECFVVVNAPELIVTGLQFSQYEGGAHGIYGLTYANYQVATGRQFGLGDVFSDTLALARRITEHFIDRYDLDAEVPLSEQGFFIDDNLLPLTDNFALLPDGAIFHYNVYEIAPYAAGAQSVKIPYEDLRDIMLFMPDFEKAEIFEADLES